MLWFAVNYLSFYTSYIGFVKCTGNRAKTGHLSNNIDWSEIQIIVPDVNLEDFETSAK